MKRGDVTNWSDIANTRNLLFLAQLINELLFDYSIPSNRISTLNSHSLCTDAMTTIATIDNNGVPEGSLKPIIAELYRSLAKDITFSRRNENPLKYFLKGQPNGNYIPTQRPDDLNYEDSKKVVYSLYQKYFQTDWYRTALFEDVRTLVVSNNEVDLLSLFRQTKALLTQLVNCGYSAKYISFVTNRLLYSKRRSIDNTSIVDELLNTFDCNTHKYRVVFLANKHHQLFLQTIKDIEFLDSLPQCGDSYYEAKFLKKKASEKYVIFEVDANDPFSASEMQKNSILDTVSIFRMFDHNYNFNISELKCGVYDENNFFYYMSEEASPVQRAKTPSKEIIEEKTENVRKAIRKTVENHNISELYSLVNAIRAHSLSLDSSSEQNQLLDLWSIFEAILDISNKHTADRIQQVCLYLVPILKRKYFFSLFAQLANDIKNYSEDTYQTIVGDSTTEFDAIMRLCSFVLLDDRKAERDQFLNSCSDFPLLKERIEYYNSQLSTPRNIFEFAEKHSERVRWQVMRIYRNRNLIMHNGESMSYLKLLVENLHAYVDDFLDYVIYSFGAGFDHVTMCHELFAKECEWQEHFGSRKAVLNIDLIKEMLMQ